MSSPFYHVLVWHQLLMATERRIELQIGHNYSKGFIGSVKNSNIQDCLRTEMARKGKDMNTALKAQFLISWKNCFVIVALKIFILAFIYLPYLVKYNLHYGIGRNREFSQTLPRQKEVTSLVALCAQNQICIEIRNSLLTSLDGIDVAVSHSHCK